MFTSKRVALVYPEKLPDNPEDGITKKDLIPFYNSYIKTLLDCPETEEITIVHRPGLKEKLKSKFHPKKLNLVESKDVQDIWIRDFAPFHMDNQIAYKGIYNPRYFQENNKKTRFADNESKIYYYASRDNNAGFDIAEKLGFEVKDFELVIDGGNFLHNDNGTGITTNRLISENENLSIEQIKELFRERIGIHELIFLPVEPGDETGHIDGMVRFIDRETVVVAAYPDGYSEGQEFMDNVARLIGSRFKVVRVINQKPEKKTQSMASAYGNYLNFLRVGNTIFLPVYGNALDADARSTYEDFAAVIPVQNDIKKLSELGGVLNCITWNY